MYEDLGLSLHHERGKFFNVVQITDEFENCIFSSSKSISLILENTEETSRFFLMDATFRITPRGIFQQVLILHFQYGIKVIFLVIIKSRNISIDSLTFHSIPDLPVCVRVDVT